MVRMVKVEVKISMGLCMGCGKVYKTYLGLKKCARCSYHAEPHYGLLRSLVERGEK